MKYVFILNSFGKRFNNDLYSKIQAVAQKLNIDYLIEVNSETLSTEDILNKYKSTRNIMVAVGGDGMINKVLNGTVNTHNMLSYLPNGTGNDFDKTVKELLNPGRNCVDCVRINTKYFINIACFGIDAEIANDDNFVHNSFIFKDLRYKAGIPFHLLNYKAKDLKIYIDDEMINRDFTTVAVCNARYYGNGYKIGPDSILNDGLAEVYLVNKLNKLDMIKTIMSIKDGSHVNNPNIEKRRVERLLIQSDIPVSSNIDGEILTANSFDIEVLPKEIEVFNNLQLIEAFEELNKNEKNKKKIIKR